MLPIQPGVGGAVVAEAVGIEAGSVLSYGSLNVVRTAAWSEGNSMKLRAV